jgi:hypothetical protein
MTGTWFAVEVLVFLENKDTQPALPKQRGQQLADRAVTDYGNIENASRCHNLPAP